MNSESQPRGSSAHLPFVLAALTIAVLGGLSLAVWLPIQAALQDPVSATWFAHAQVHGHLQTIGFAGLFIIGVSYFMMPGFAGRPLAFPWLVRASLWALVAAVLLRTFGQPLADHPPFAAMMALGALLEVAGAAAFLVIVASTLRDAVRRGRPFAPLFVLGAFWFLVQAILGAVWLTELAFDGATILEARRSVTLVALQVFGFHLAFILGVVVQAFPGFFASRRPGIRELVPPMALVQLGVLTVLVARLAELADAPLDVLENLGHLTFGAGVVWLGGYSGWWQGPQHMSRVAARFATVLWPAMAWLALVGTLSALFALRGLIEDRPPDTRELDTMLHVATIGVVLLLIVGMAQLLLPEFASERIAGRQGLWRSLLFGLGLSLAVILRAGGRYFAADLDGDGAQWSMATAGAIALALTVVFAVLVLRSRRQHRQMMSRIESGEIAQTIRRL
jgi:hypothetical protein